MRVPTQKDRNAALRCENALFSEPSPGAAGPRLPKPSPAQTHPHQGVLELAGKRPVDAVALGTGESDRKMKPCTIQPKSARIPKAQGSNQQVASRSTAGTLIAQATSQGMPHASFTCGLLFSATSGSDIPTSKSAKSCGPTPSQERSLQLGNCALCPPCLNNLQTDAPSECTTGWLFRTSSMAWSHNCLVTVSHTSLAPTVTYRSLHITAYPSSPYYIPQSS
jgi:hypothetical protein